MGKRLTYVLSGCMLLIMWAESGCTKQSLDHRKREGHVHIALQWDKGYTPAGSRFYFYPEDGSEAIVRDCPKEGFSGNAAGGQLSGHCAEQRCPEYRAAQRTAASDRRNLRLARRGGLVGSPVHLSARQSAAGWWHQRGGQAGGSLSGYRQCIGIASFPCQEDPLLFQARELRAGRPVQRDAFRSFLVDLLRYRCLVRTLRQTFVSPLRQPRGSTISRPMSLFLIWRVPKKPAELICWI